MGKRIRVHDAALGGALVVHGSVRTPSPHQFDINEVPLGMAVRRGTNASKSGRVPRGNFASGGSTAGDTIALVDAQVDALPAQALAFHLRHKNFCEHALATHRAGSYLFMIKYSTKGLYSMVVRQRVVVGIG